MDDALSPSHPGDGSETSLPEVLRKLAYTAFIVGGLFVVMEMVLAGRAPPPPEAATSYPFRFNQPQVPTHESRTDVSPSILLSSALAATSMRTLLPAGS